MATRPARSATDWLDAAYARFSADGISGVRVEVLARDLGATKGSFYWHYADRSELVTAVMARWEHEETDALIEIADVGGTPREQLMFLYTAVGESAGRRRGETRLYVEAKSEGVVDYLTRVSRRRIDYIASVLESAGVPEDEARRRGIISLATALGLEQLTVATDLDVIDVDGRALTESAVRMALVD